MVVSVVVMMFVFVAITMLVVALVLVVMMFVLMTITMLVVAIVVVVVMMFVLVVVMRRFFFQRGKRLR